VKLEIRGTDFWIDGRPTYEGRIFDGNRIEGLLMNSRMVQCIFDDEYPETRSAWAYPDTGEWDPDRNTEEFCHALPDYRRHGLLAVTVGLQGGGSVYRPDIYDYYLASAFRPDGSLKPAWLARLTKVLNATNQAGIAVIINPFYWRQERFESDEAILRATQNTMEFLLEGGWEHLMIDLKNEIQPGEGLLKGGGIHRALQVCWDVRGKESRAPYIGVSTFPKKHHISDEIQERVEFWMPHGNDSTPAELRQEIEEVRNLPSNKNWPRPILVNEDSIHIDNMMAAVAVGASWGYYDQGYGCHGNHGRFNFSEKPRESEFAELSGFQTVPVNWGINTDHKRAFFNKLAEITGSLPV
jgi:hypothetical protein